MNKAEKLLKRPIEKDTKILLEHIVDFKNFTALMELWNFDGISGSTIIVLKSDVVHYPQEMLLEILFKEMKQPLDPQATYSEMGEYIFVNFGFKAD